MVGAEAARGRLPGGGWLGDDDGAAAARAEGQDHGDSDGAAAEDQDVRGRRERALGDGVPADAQGLDERADVQGHVVWEREHVVGGDGDGVGEAAAPA